MSVILTQKYAHIIEKRGLKRVFYILINFFPLITDIYKSGKLTELVSFAIWEFLHTFKIYKKEDYLRFCDKSPLVLKKNSDISKLNFDNEDFSITRVENWKVLFIDKKGDIYATLADDPKTLYKKEKNSTIKKVYSFKDIINSIFVTKKGVVLVCSCGNLYRSDDKAKSFEKILKLSNPQNPESYIFHSNGFTEDENGAVFIGEYGNVAKDGAWMNVANIYKSQDDAKSWQKSDFLKKKGVNKHIHMIKYSKILKRVFLTDGDNLKKLWISEKEGDFDIDKEWKLVNRFHIQMGGYTSMCESLDKIYLGTDYLGGTNFLVATKDLKRFEKKVIPDPYRRSPIMNLKKLDSKKSSIWAILHNPISSKTRCVLIYKKEGQDCWRRVLEYDGTVHEIQLNSDTNSKQKSIFFALTDKRKNIGVCYEIRGRR